MKKKPSGPSKSDIATDILLRIRDIDPSDEAKHDEWLNLHTDLADLCFTDKELANSNEVIKVLLKFANSFQDDRQANQLLDTFSQQGIGQQNALWMVSYALSFEILHQFLPPFLIFDQAFGNQITSPFIHDKYREFKERMVLRLKDNSTLDLGMCENYHYQWKNGQVMCTEDGRLIDPVIDILSIIDYRPPNQSATQLSISAMSKEIPAYKPALLLGSDGPRSFIEARLESLGVDFVAVRKSNEELNTLTLPKKKSAIVPRNSDEYDPFQETTTTNRVVSPRVRKPLTLIESKVVVDPVQDPPPSTAKSSERRKPTLNSVFTSNIEEDNEEFDPFNGFKLPKKKSGIIKKRQPLAPISPFAEDQPKSILKGPGKISQPSPTHSVKIAPGSNPKASPRRAFAVGDIFTADEMQMTIIEKLGENSFLCQSLEGEKFALKILPAPSILKKLEHKELFVLPESRFKTYFVTKFVDIPFAQVIPIIRGRKPDENVLVFILFQLNRMLMALEKQKCVHGSIAIENIVYIIPNGELPPFDDSGLWKEAGIALCNCDKIKEGKGNDRKAVMQLICCILNEDPDNVTVPKLWKKDFWESSFKALSSPSVPLKTIETEANARLRDKGKAIRSAISRINVSLLTKDE